MIRAINKNVSKLRVKSDEASLSDKQIIIDLVDTLKAHEDECVGMAANMIGEYKRIVICQMGPFAVPMINPRITKKSKLYQTKEGCLSLMGERPTTRYENITVEYLDRKFVQQSQDFSGLIAQIIQHEMDHCDGIII
ncbi:peptide deformylase [Liquorilactobacillus mali]|uniref:Peptide deformylase n=1 Tax=Liquorilactobacillus mali KCTC 3596 = DSM 20444 TaxID=1046596 RepID=J1F023_9LACO|nr:peptide deformylase [Liquorilactobacillus mali]EJE97266.1 formylmethionine deformylase [Liquorilactobacillus mali KCTC 3596 = DSM 20444]KRN11347.1 peptide deformylase [Liquorilactobacillus mali KCTC 3596 = DSM 20444]MDC7953148.1 peptide deformylase [Liquorilactobacillus mali]MDV7757259.1 peptide deformylase [Liquorilactobacillus mali]QFQ75319.1 peptide deformylase [Liquorilactobacillus mali]